MVMFIVYILFPIIKSFPSKNMLLEDNNISEFHDEMIKLKKELDLNAKNNTHKNQMMEHKKTTIINKRITVIDRDGNRYIYKEVNSNVHPIKGNKNINTEIEPNIKNKSKTKFISVKILLCVIIVVIILLSIGYYMI